MTRYKYQSYAKDGKGNVIEDATISAYLAGTTTPASVYTAASTGSAVNSVTSDSAGYFYFWVDNGDYGSDQQFKIVITKTGFAGATLDDLLIYPYVGLDGPSSSTDDNIATFDGATGEVIQDSGVGISTVTSNTGFRTTPSSAITAGTNLSWSSNTLNASDRGFATLSDHSDNLAVAVAAIGATATTLYINAAVDALTADVTIPSTLSLVWDQGHEVIGAYTLTINGDLSAGNYKIFDSTVTVAGTLNGRSRNVKWWGAVGDGATADSTAINACFASITSAVSTSAVVFFPIGIYMIDAIVEIHSSTRINVNAYGATFMPDNNSVTMFQYAYDGTTHSYLNGGGVFAGAKFTDTYSAHSDFAYWREGTHTGVTAFHMFDMDNSLLKDCSFEYVNGTAIKTERAIMTNIDNCDVVNCGATGLPAIDIAPDSAQHNTQAFNISNCKIETNYYEAYIEISSYAKKIKLLGCGFEADAYLTTQRRYIDSDNDAITISGCHFGKNAGSVPRVNLTGDEKIISNCIFSGDASVMAIDDAGNNLIVTGCTIADNVSLNSGYSIDSAGSNVSITKNILRNGGGIRCSGTENAVISNNTITLSGSSDPAIYTAATATTITGNVLLDITGGGIRVADNAYGATITGNSMDSVTGIGIQIGAGASGANILGNSLWVIGGVGISIGTGIVTCVGNTLVAVSGAEITPFNDTNRIAHNEGYITEKSDVTGALLGATSVVVTHGLATTPKAVTVTPNLVIDGWSITTLTTTQFTINFNALAANTSFYWNAQVRE